MSHVSLFSSVRVLCLGDVMLDRFIGGQVRRISPESPVPVLSVTKTEIFAGGAANVARNIAALGGRCTMVGIVGRDGAAADLVRLLTADGCIVPAFVTVDGRPTTEKTRFIAQGQHMLRADAEDAAPAAADVEDELLARVARELPQHGVLVLSDYAKGVLTDRVVTGAIGLARAAGVPVIVDPKARDFSRYDGATLITPNARETYEATGIDPVDEGEAVAAGRKVLATTTIAAVLITRAEKGMTLVTRDGEPGQIAATAREVADVVGAGDTVIATLALAIGAGASKKEAAALANAAAGVVVGKRGTATLTRSELLAELGRESRTGHASPAVKVLSASEAGERVRAWQRDGLRVGFTNGCFDILHVGHLGLLDFSRANCDRLVVAVNTDASVRRLKGPTRPINTEADRALLLAAFSVVDVVVLFDDDTPAELIAALRPDVLVKGADYTIDRIVGADQVLARGGQVLRFALVADKSTTKTLEKARAGSAQIDGV